MKTEATEIISSDGLKIPTLISTPDGNTRGCIVLCHGITVDKDENGKFIDVTNYLCNNLFKVVRFDFRGHGESNLLSEEMTISGELLDLTAVISSVIDKNSAVGILAVSFGAGASILYTAKNQEIIKTLVLWNPVIDYKKTFLKPQVPWGKTFFNESGYKELNNDGYITITGTKFRIGKKLVEEFSIYEPYKILQGIKCPVLTVHGKKDTKVPFDIAKKYGCPNKNSKFIPVDSDHGFGDKKDFVYKLTEEWFKKNI